MRPKRSVHTPAARHILLLTNPGAGSTDQAAIDAAIAVWHDAGAAVARRDLTEQSQVWVDDAASGAYDRVVLAGGDGTVHRVVSTLTAHGDLSALTLAVLPLGTGNDYARSAGLPADPRAAARVALRGARRPVDLLRDDRGVVAVNAAHIGLGALAAERAHAMKEMMGPLAYLGGALLAGASMADYPIRVQVDGADATEDGQRLLMVGLSMGRTIGGGAPLAPEARVDDGLVDVVLVSATGAAARAAFARSLQQGSHVDRDDVRVVRGRSVVIHGGDAPLNVDGELLGPAGTRAWMVVPDAWAIVVPD